MNFLKRVFIPDISLPDKQWVEEKKYKTLSMLFSIVVFTLMIFLIIRYIQGNTYLVIVNSIGIPTFRVDKIRKQKLYF